MLLVTDCVKKLHIAMLDDVRLVEVNAAFIGACYGYARLCEECNVSGVITGAGREPVYLREPFHMKGYAWDFRSYIFTDPTSAARRLSEILKEIDAAFRVVYIKPPKPVHFHVEYRGAR